MMKYVIQKITERATLHLTLRYQREILVGSMRLIKMMILWTRTSTLTNQSLQMPRVCIFQLENLQSMILPNLVGWIIAKYDGKGSARYEQFSMANLKYLSRKQVTCPYAGIVDAHSVHQRSNVPIYAKDSNLHINLLVK